MMMKKLFLTLCLMAAAFAAEAQNEKITNQTVLDLLKEGFSSEEIIGALESSTERAITYDLNYMRQLKAAGADATLTTYIQKIAKTDYGYEGVLWWNTGDKPRKMHRTQFERESKSMNLGTVALMGAGALIVGSAVGGHSPSGAVAAGATAGAIALMSSGKDIQKLMLPGATSKLQVTTTRPVFRFYFPKVDPKSFEKTGASWYQVIMNNIESPNEFQCVKMQSKKPNKKGKGGRRLFPEGVSYSTMGFEGKNASNRIIVDFEITDVNNTTFEVTFAQELEPGEYCFFYKSGLNSQAFKEHPFGFDFTITGKE